MLSASMDTSLLICYFHPLFDSLLSLLIFFPGVVRWVVKMRPDSSRFALGQCGEVSTEGSSPFISRDLQIAPLLQRGFIILFWINGEEPQNE